MNIHGINFTKLKFHGDLTMQVFDFSPMNESLSTCVSLLALNGRCPPFLPRARMHSFNANNDLLISAPSIPARKNKMRS